MATKKKTNTISALYKTIDQKQLSEQAKETLKKLRLATGNFRSKDERANEAFNAFYTKLLEKKPSAVKTTKEYKDMVRQRQVEHMKKIREARKEKEESKKGQGNDRDAARPAKPYGWRLRGKHNYRKPTLKQIRDGEAYYEGRVNRADVKRRKFPMLEKGGYMEHGGKLNSGVYKIGNPVKISPNLYEQKIVEIFDNGDISTASDYGRKLSDFSGLNYPTISKQQLDAQYKMADGGYMEHGGKLNSGVYKIGNPVKISPNLYEQKIVEIFDNGDISTASDYGRKLSDFSGLNYPTISKQQLDAQYKMADGGYMEHGGAIKNQYEGRTPEDIWDSYTKEQKLHFLYDHHEEINEYKGISSEEENPWFNVSYKSNWANLDEDVKNRFANHVRGGQYAKGGMTDHNLMVGDTIKQSFGNIIVVENDGKTYLVNINTGQRWTDSEWWSLSKGEITKYTKMAKGGYVDVKENLIKELGRLQRQLNSDRLRVFKEDGSTEEMERQRERASKKARFDDILKTLNEIESNEKMAKGGEIKYSTYDNKSMEYIEGEIAHTERSARQFQQMGDYESMEDRKEHVRKLREIYNRKRAESKMAQGGEVFYKESHKMGH